MKYTICITKDQRDFYISDLENNLCIYKEIVKSYLPPDIETYGNAIAEYKMSEGQIMDGLVEENIFKNKWNNASYRLCITWICLTYQLWEQQVLQWICDLIDLYGLKEYSYKYPESQKEVTDFINPYNKGVHVRDISSWEIVNEMRLVTNVVKHSEGDAARKLRRKRPDLFIRDGKGIAVSGDTDDYLMGNVHTAIGIPVLNLRDEDIERYTMALKTFWEEISRYEISVSLEIKKEEKVDGLR